MISKSIDAYTPSKTKIVSTQETNIGKSLIQTFIRLIIIITQQLIKD